MKSSSATDFSLTYLQIHIFVCEQKSLTVECQVAKNGSQEVHNKHGEKGDIGHHLHFFL